MTNLTANKKLTIATLGAAFITMGIGKAAQATVLNFDDIAPADTYASIPDGYGGFSWDNFYYRNSSDPNVSGSGFETGKVSGSYTALNGSGNTAVVKNALFDFDSTYLTSAWNDGLSIIVQGFKNGDSKYSETVIVNANAPTLFNFNYRDIDQLKFTSLGGENAGLGGKGTQFVMDNFTYHAVPEPTSMLGTLAVGAFGASAVLKGKKQRKV